MKLLNKTLLIIFMTIIIGIIGYLLLGKILVVGYMLGILISSLGGITLMSNNRQI